MAENQTKCTGNCMSCTIFQRQYCASQLAYSNMRMLEQVQQFMVSMNEDVKSLSDKVEAMQNNESTLFYPTITESSDSEVVVESNVVPPISQ